MILLFFGSIFWSHCWVPLPTKCSNRAFLLTWPASMQIYWNKRKLLHKKRVQRPQDWFGTPTWPPFHCFGTPIWPPWRHVKTLYRAMEKISDKFYQVKLNIVHFWLIFPGITWKPVNVLLIYDEKTETHTSYLSLLKLELDNALQEFKRSINLQFVLDA